MLFPEEDAPLLKTWIVKRIENTSDADSDVLADYVIALLKHDGDVESVRQLCEAEIPDFLTEDPKTFLDDVFQAIAFKSYRPGAPPPPKPAATGILPPPPPADSNGFAQPAASKKRGFQDLGERDYQDELDAHHGGGRGHKQARRGSRRGGRMDDATAGRYRGGYPPLGAMTGLPAFDPKNPLQALLQMQALGIPFPGIPDFAAPGPSNGGRNAHRRKGRCRDFDTKGYCSRGNTCMYDHGNDSIYVPSLTNQGEEYDPSNAVLGMSYDQTNNPSLSSDKGRHRDRGGRGGRGGKRGARAIFSADGPVTDRTKSTIVVENIPEENFSVEEVRGYFSQFGNITEVSMQPYKHLAIVKYDKWGSANSAYRSPKVIFDNRFVKVFWYKEGGDVLPPSMFATGSNGMASNGHIEPADVDIKSELDMEAFQRKQEEAQKQYQERESKKIDLERQRQELEKQQEELLAKHKEESERLKAKLAVKNGESTENKSSGSSSATDMLKAQLAALEQEAKILGIDPDAADDGSGYNARGGGFRGRGGRGGRGDRGSLLRGRGSFRGQAGRHAAYAQYSLDNRPKKLTVKGVDFTPSDKDEALRHFLLNLGEFESVETTPSATYVSFQDRKVAEKFYHSLHGKELPGVDGTLELEWVNTPLPPVKMSDAAVAAAATAKKMWAGEGASADNGSAAEQDTGGDAMAGMDDGFAHANHHEDEDHVVAERQVDMDYDVAEEGEWVE